MEFSTIYHKFDSEFFHLTLGILERSGSKSTNCVCLGLCIGSTYNMTCNVLSSFRGAVEGFCSLDRSMFSPNPSLNCKIN